MNIKWDADKYSSDFSFVSHYGNSVIELIDAGPHSTAIDLGCGNGALSKALHEKGFRVKGIDSSKELLEIAKKNYPEIDFLEADATNFTIQEQVDIVFSNAVLHWIDKEHQSEMLKCVSNALKQHGQFVFELGGYGNNLLIHRALSEAFSRRNYDYNNTFYFPKIGEYASLLENAGFKVIYAVLFDRPTELKGNDGLKDWINMFIKTPFIKITDRAERIAIMNETVENLRNGLYKDGKWYADYVRLRMKALKG